MDSRDGGRTWVRATRENFPKGGITVEFDYPVGMNGLDYRFKVAHMMTVAMNGWRPGDIETTPVTLTEKRNRVTLTGLSPVALTWQKIETKDQIQLPQTGDSSNPVPYGLTAAIALVGISILMRMKKRR